MLVIIPKTLIMMITIDKRWTLLKEDNVAEDDGGDGGNGGDGDNGGDDGEDSDAGKADKQ